MPDIPTCEYPGCNLIAVNRCGECNRLFCIKHMQGGVCDLDSAKHQKTASRLRRNGCLITLVGGALAAIVGIAGTSQGGVGQGLGMLGVCAGSFIIIGLLVLFVSLFQ
jgi:hypothetical protein